MYTIRESDYGFYIEMGGVYSQNEIESYIIDQERHACNRSAPFAMVVDLREAMPPSENDSIRLVKHQERLKKMGLTQMILIIKSPVLLQRARQVLHSSKVYASAKVFIESECPNWRSLAEQVACKSVGIGLLLSDEAS